MQETEEPATKSTAGSRPNGRAQPDPAERTQTRPGRNQTRPGQPQARRGNTPTPREGNCCTSAWFSGNQPNRVEGRAPVSLTTHPPGTVVLAPTARLDQQEPTERPQPVDARYLTRNECGPRVHPQVMERPRRGETDPTEATLPHPKVREGPVNRRHKDAKSASGKAWGAMVMLNAIKPSCASLARRNAPPNPEYWAGPCDEFPGQVGPGSTACPTVVQEAA